jgi:hypothetical protein
MITFNYQQQVICNSSETTTDGSFKLLIFFVVVLSGWIELAVERMKLLWTVGDENERKNA